MAECKPYETMTEEDILTKLKHSREHCEEGRWCEADKVYVDNIFHELQDYENKMI